MSKRLNSAVRISLIYAIVGSLWIVLSDSVLAAFISDAETLNIFQTYKGWFYVLITTFMLYGLVSASERSSRASEERLNLALHGTNTGLHEWYPKTDETYFSPTWFTMLGYEPDEFPHNYDTWAQLLHPEDRPNAEKIVQEFLRTRDSSFTTEFRMRGQDGQYRWIYDQGVAVGWDENGDITRMVGTHTDITERKRAEEQLRRERDFNQTLIQASPAFFVAIDADGKTIMINDAMLYTLGYSGDEVIGSDYLTTFVPEEDRGTLSQVFGELMRSGKPTLNINRVLTKDGRERLVEWHGRSSFNESGDFDYFIGLGIDITERTQAEGALRASEATARALLNAPADIILLFDTSGVLLDVNEAAVRSYAKSWEELVGLCIWDLLPPDLSERRKPYVDKVIQSGEPVRFEDEREGTWFDNVLYPIFDERQKVSKIAVIAHDITERKLAEVTLRESDLRFRSLIEHTTDAIFCYEYDPPIPTDLPIKEQAQMFYQGVLAECNDVSARSYGATRAKEVIGKKLTELFGTSPGSLDNFFAAFIQNGYRTVDAESVELLEDGTERYFLNNGHGVVENGRLLRVWGAFRDITERKQAEQALRESERRYRDIAANIPGAVYQFRIDPDGAFAVPYMSESGEALFGRPLVELTDSSFLFDDIHPDDLALFQQSISQAAQRMERWTHEFRIVKVGDQVKWLRGSSNPRRLPDGGILWDGVLLDITAHKQAEEALQEAYNKYNVVIENAGVGIIVIQDGQQVFYNPRMYEMLGYTEREYLNFNFLSLVHPEDRSLAVERIRQRLTNAGMDSASTQMRVRAKPGEIKWIETNSVKIQWEGRPAVQAFVADITERKQAEEALRKSERKYRKLFEDSIDMIAITTPEGQLVDINQAGERLFGYSREELMVQNVQTIYAHSEDREKFRQGLERDGAIRDFETQFHRADGTIIDVVLNATVQWAEDGTISGFQSIVHDITERKQAENEIKERLRFEELVSGLSARFVGVEVNQIELEIERAFENIGTDFDIDQIVLWELSKDKKQYHISHSWAAEEMDPIQITLSADSFPYIKKKLLSQGEPLIFSSVEELPEEAITEKHYYDQQGIKSGLVIPLIIAGDVIGGLSLSVMRIHRNWSAEIVQRLFILGEILANALIRKRIEEDLRESESRLSSFMNSASDSFYLLDADLNFVEINQKGLEIVGQRREDIIGKNIADIVPNVKESGRYEKHLEVIRTGQPYAIDDFVPHPVFGDLHFVLKSFKVGDGLGVIASDITERKRAEEALWRYAEHLQILHQIDQGILAARSPEAIARAVVGHVRRLIPCRRITVVSFNLVANEAVELAVDEDTDSGLGEGTRISLESLEDVIEELRQGRIAAWGDLPSRGKALEMLYTEGIRSYISMPLMVRGELVGALNFGMTEPTALSQEQEELARQVANQLAIAIHQARLYEQVQRHSEELEQRVADRTQELSVLYEVAALASQSLELETTLARSLEQVLRAMRSEIGAIHLLSEAEGTAVDETSAGEVFRLAVQQGIPPDLATEMESLPADAELARSVAELDRPLVVAGITSDPRVFATLPSMMLRARPIEPHTYVGMPLRASGRALGILSVARRTEQPEHSVEELSLLISIADQLGVVVESNRLRKQAEQAAVLEERERLARDLHDSVTQLLYTVSLFATTGKGALGSGDQELLEHALSQLENAAQQALKEMRLMLYELRPPVLAQLGLVRALRRRLESVEGRVGVDARLLTGKGVELPMQVEQELYLIALEALNNGLKYSNATSVTVDIDAGEEQVELKVIDNGVGFDLDAVEADGGLGLTNMRQRAERLGGVLRIVSAPGAGTQVVATVPYGD